MIEEIIGTFAFETTYTPSLSKEKITKILYYEIYKIEGRELYAYKLVPNQKLD